MDSVKTLDFLRNLAQHSMKIADESVPDFEKKRWVDVAEKITAYRLSSHKSLRDIARECKVPLRILIFVEGTKKPPGVGRPADLIYRKITEHIL